MPYSAEISRTNPSCILFLIDQSGSMQDPMPGGSKSKADTLADCINKCLKDLIIMCTKAEGVRDYFSVGVIGYGAKVGSAFSGKLAGKELVALSEVANNPARIEERKKKEDDGAGGVFERTVRFPIWFDAVSTNGTPMCQALGLAHNILSKWIARHPNSFPPIVLHFTDGESQDGDPSSAAEKIKGLSTQDGNVLLFNLHISSIQVAQSMPRPLFGVPPKSPDSVIIFPDDTVPLPDKYAQLLFNMSSVLPLNMRVAAQQDGHIVSEKARGFAFNADLGAVVTFLNIGTRPSNLR